MPYQHPREAGGGAILLIFHRDLWRPHLPGFIVIHVEVGSSGPMMKSITLPEFAQSTEGEFAWALHDKCEIAQRIAFPEWSVIGRCTEE